VRHAVVGVVAIILFDTLASIVSRVTGLSYHWFALGSALTYGAIGFSIVRAGDSATLYPTLLLVGAAEASVGWYISWQIGPGRPPVDQRVSPGLVLASVGFTLLIAVACGALGARFAR